MELQSPVLVGLSREQEDSDWSLPAALMKKRQAEKIEDYKSLAKSWRMKDQVRETPGTPPEGGYTCGGGVGVRVVWAVQYVDGALCGCDLSVGGDTGGNIISYSLGDLPVRP